MGHKNTFARRACAMLGGTLAGASAVAVCLTGTAQAAVTPSAQLSFSPATIKTGTAPHLAFMSKNVPSGALLYLQESTDAGQHWKTIEKTTSTQATASIAALPRGDYEFRVLITENSDVLAASAPASLTVTGPDGSKPTPAPKAHAPAPAPKTVPSGSSVPWLKIIKIAWQIIRDWFFIIL